MISFCHEVVESKLCSVFWPACCTDSGPKSVSESKAACVGGVRSTWQESVEYTYKIRHIFTYLPWTPDIKKCNIEKKKHWSLSEGNPPRNGITTFWWVKLLKTIPLQVETHGVSPPRPTCTQTRRRSRVLSMPWLSGPISGLVGGRFDIYGLNPALEAISQVECINFMQPGKIMETVGPNGLFVYTCKAEWFFFFWHASSLCWALVGYVKPKSHQRCSRSIYNEFKLNSQESIQSMI